MSESQKDKVMKGQENQDDYSKMHLYDMDIPDLPDITSGEPERRGEVQYDTNKWDDIMNQEDKEEQDAIEAEIKRRE